MINRLVWIDNLKGFLIVLVVLGHAIQETIKGDCFDNHLWNYIYSFHMAGFFSVSGFLSYKAYTKRNARITIIFRRVRQLLVPFILWSLIKVIAYQSCSINAFISIFLYPDRYFWFLWVLFFISVFFLLGDWIAEILRIKQEVVILGFAFFFVVLMVFADIRILGFQFFAYYFMFYIVGYYLHKYNLSIMSNTWVICSLFVVWVFLGWFWKMHELPVLMRSIPLPQTLMQYTYRFVTALVAVFILIGIGPRYLDREKWWNEPFVRLGQISLGIYVVHLLLLPMLMKWIGETVSNRTTIVFFAFVISLMCSWGVVWLLGKWKLTARLLLGKIG